MSDETIISRYPYVFCEVEPIGDFVVDPDGDVTSIELIDPKDYRKYINWGESGDRIITRALELKTLK